MESSFIPMATFLRESGCTTRLMGKAHITMRMDLNILVTGLRISSTGKTFYICRSIAYVNTEHKIASLQLFLAPAFPLKLPETL